jgi:adenylosuccinate lyase
LDPATFIGRSPEIVTKLVETKVKPALEKYAEALKTAQVAELKV